MVSRQEDDLSVVFPAATAIPKDDNNPNAEGFSDLFLSSRLRSSDQNGILNNAEGDKRQVAEAVQQNIHPFNGHHSHEGIK
jgi:hypothetical protein